MVAKGAAILKLKHGYLYPNKRMERGIIKRTHNTVIIAFFIVLIVINLICLVALARATFGLVYLGDGTGLIEKQISTIICTYSVLTTVLIILEYLLNDYFPRLSPKNLASSVASGVIRLKIIILFYMKKDYSDEYVYHMNDMNTKMERLLYFPMRLVVITFIHVLYALMVVTWMIPKEIYFSEMGIFILGAIMIPVGWGISILSVIKDYMDHVSSGKE